MRSRSLFLLFFPLCFLSGLSQSPPPPKGWLIDCGSATGSSTPEGLRWLPDTRYIAAGEPRNLSLPDLLPVLSTLRSFPLSPGLLDRPRKFCYVLPAYRGARYLIRTTYFFGGFDGVVPPVFDQIVDGTFWTTVNTTKDYAAGVASYYEGVFLARGKTMSVCVASNKDTTSAPFISALEMIMLDDSVYNGTEFSKYAMGLIARSNFGSTGSILRYPDDRFDRYWHPYSDGRHDKSSIYSISTSDLWNLPPTSIYKTALVADQEKSYQLPWPPNLLPDAIYYVALYFADTVPEGNRNFSVFVNEYSFYSNLTVTSSGLVVFANQWNLSGETMITMTSGSPFPSLINAGEIFGLFLIGNLTQTKDIIALQKIKESIAVPPSDWSGDPCMPPGYSWTGVTCTYGPRIRVVSLNVSGMGLSGSISPYISTLTAVANISLANNNFTGQIPDLGRLRNLERLHLQDNQLTGFIPPSLANLVNLRELYVQNNSLSGIIPPRLFRNGLDFRYRPGNYLLLRINK